MIAPESPNWSAELAANRTCRLLPLIVWRPSSTAGRRFQSRKCLLPSQRSSPNARRLDARSGAEPDPVENQAKTRLVIVTGGLSGIGAAAARALSERGQGVVVIDLAAATTAQPETPSNIVAHDEPVDVSDETMVARSCETIERRHGPVSGLVITRPETGPCRRSIVSQERATIVSSETSTGSSWATILDGVSGCAVVAAARSMTTTPWPRSLNARAAAAPIPLSPPVT